MLNAPTPSSLQPSRRGRQRGVVLIIALIALVIMTLAALAMIRSVDTSNLIAGNMAFQQAATHSGDSGIEAAITWLSDCNFTNASCAASLVMVASTISNRFEVSRYCACSRNRSRIWGVSGTPPTNNSPVLGCL